VSRATTVLVVDSDPNLRAALARLLARRGCRVLVADDGLRAVELAAAHAPDVALVELLLPGQSGFRVAADLKARHGDAVRVVVASAVASEAHRDYALATGADNFLPKPFTANQLYAAVGAAPVPAA
jgi:two-component system response regulator RpaA